MKMLSALKRDWAIPSYWGKNTAGMQALGELSPADKPVAEEIWKQGMEGAVYIASQLNSLEVHKQTANRVLEPYSHISVVVTATEWDNFYTLRDHEDAQPEIQRLAKTMKIAVSRSSPLEIHPGEWHLPFVSMDEIASLESGTTLEELQKASVARCARVSYLNHDKSAPSLEKDIELADRLLEAGHMSPFEHQGTPMEGNGKIVKLGGVHHYLNQDGVTHFDRNGLFWSGNFQGWIQYRQML